MTADRSTNYQHRSAKTMSQPFPHGLELAELDELPQARSLGPETYRPHQSQVRGCTSRSGDARSPLGESRLPRAP